MAKPIAGSDSDLTLALMDNGFQITMTRVGDHTYSWRPQSRLSKLFLTVIGLALLVALASFAIGAIVVSAFVIMALVATAVVRVTVRRWLNRHRGGAPAPADSENL